MQRILLGIDELSTWVGKFFAWTIVVLTFAIAYEVFMRYVLSAPTMWAYDAEYILYGTLFMMGGAYTLSRNGHVRGDFLYRAWPIKTQGIVDLVLYFVCFFPAILAMIYSGWGYFWLSFSMNEHSSFSPAGPPIWPFKFLIPLAGVLMLLQGIAEVVRSIITIRTGVRPDKLHDVEETETIILMEAEFKKAEGIAEGDKK